MKIISIRPNQVNDFIEIEFSYLICPQVFAFF